MYWGSTGRWSVNQEGFPWGGVISSSSCLDGVAGIGFWEVQWLRAWVLKLTCWGRVIPALPLSQLYELGQPLNLSLALKRGIQWHLFPGNVVRIVLCTVLARGKYSYK